jgi:hypothetical protein
MELSKRYVHAVTESLPQAQRNEVARELSASIEDMARDKSHGKEPSEKHIREVLEELGNPLVVAQQYRGTKEYLIGPAFYYYYIEVLKRILAVSLPIYSLVFAITFDYVFPLNVGNLVVSYGVGLATVALHVLFWVTGLFVVIEKAGVKVKQFSETEGEWSVNSLPPLPEEPQISRVDTVASMSFYAGMAVGSLVLWRLLSQGDTNVTWLLNTELSTFWIPALLVFSILALVVEGVKLFSAHLGAWKLVASLMINTIMTAFVVALAATQSILNPELSGHVRDIALWSIGITVVVFVCSYISESYKLIQKYRKSRLAK